MAKNNIKQLNQDYERLVEVLDATDDALKVKDAAGNPYEANLNKIWTTAVDIQTDASGTETRVSKIAPVSFADFTEYQDIKSTTDQLNETINHEQTGILTQLTAVNEQLERISDLIGEDYVRFTILPIPNTYYSVLFKNKQDLVIKYKFESVNGTTGPTGPGSVVWKMGNQILAQEERIRQNIMDKNNPDYNNDYNSFDFSKYAHVGENKITGIFTDSMGNTKDVTWTITAVDLSLNIIDFQETELYNDKIEIHYSVQGLGEDTSASVYFQLDNATPTVINFSSQDQRKTFTVAKQSHGSHLLSVYAKAIVDGATLTTNTQLLDLMCVEAGNNTPVIRWPYDSTLELEQYNAYDFNYSVYDPQNTVANITRKAEITYVDNNTNTQEVLIQSWNNTADWSSEDEKSLVWTFVPNINMNKETTGTVKLSITCGDVTKTKTFKLKPTSLGINPVTRGLVLDFNPEGRTNQDTNYQNFTYTNDRYTTTMTVSDNFNWTHGGWQKDENGHDVFIIKTGSRMYLDYPLFYEDKDAKQEGRHIKMTYKATNCASFDASVMSCNEYQGLRHEITPEEFYLNEDGEIESSEDTTRYFLNGYNVHEETNDLLWNENGELITESYDKDERDASGLGILYHIKAEESYIGLEVKAQEALLHSSYNDLPLVYCEDEKMSLSVDIEKSGDSEARLNLMTGYIDADPIRVVKYDTSTSFTQKEKQQIEFGSDECDVLIYRFKIFTRHLENQRSKTEINEVFDDYIADIPDAEKRLETYNQNDFLNADGTININKLQEKCPDLRIILITCPKRFTIDKNDKVKGCTVEHILPSGGPKDHWIAENVQVKGQGTSSNAYGTSARNIDIKLNKKVIKDEEGNEQELDYSLIYWDENGEEQHATKYSMSEDAIAVNYFNIKVNVASSENANNACLADWFNEFNPYKRAVKTNGVRDTMEFHPCAIFIREGSADEWVEFEPEYDESNQLKYHFYACGDFGNSKKNHDVFGMGKQAELDVENAGDSITIDGDTYDLTDEDQKKTAIHKLQLKECIVEFSNNTHPVCLFEKPDGWDDILPNCFDFDNMQVTQYADFWTGEAIEFRYPEDVVEGSYNKNGEFSEEEIAEARERLEVLQPQVQRLWRWVESVDPRKATNQIFTPSVQLAVPSPILAERVQKTYDADTAEYRKAKFLKEYKDYFEDESMLFHYLFTDRYLMIDNRVKNVFLHTTDGLHWDFCFNYDDDTSLGCENSGFLTLDYNLEDSDKINGIDVYNGNSSVLWENVRTILVPELKAMYNNDACKDAWSSSALLGKMTQYQAHKPILLEMIDMYRKYIRPYKIGHGWSANKPLPTSEPQYLERMNGRKALQRKRFETYRDIYTGSKYQAASFSSSNNDITFRVNKNGGIMEITPYCDMYPAIKWGDAYYTPTENKRVRRNEKCYIDLTPGGTNVGNQELHFCGASMLSDLGPLAKFQIYEANFNNGTKLKRILFGDHTGTNRSNVTITTMSLPTTPLLEEVDVSYTQYKNELNFKNQPMIKAVYCENSKVPGVTFAENGIVEVVKLNNQTELKMIGLTKLREFSMSTDSWTSVNIQNTPYLTTGSRAIEFIKSMPRTITGQIDGLDINVSEADTRMLDRFISNNSANLELIGAASFNKFYESMLKSYEIVWPKLVVSYDPDNFVQQYLIQFKNYDGTLLTSFYVDEGQQFTNPYEQIKDLLVKPQDAQYTYEYKGWNSSDFDENGDYVGGNVYEERVYIAEYTATDREYSITWHISRSSWEQASGKVTKTYQYSLSGLRYMDDVELQSDGKVHVINRLTNTGYPSYDINFVNIDDESDVLSLSQVIAPGRVSRTTYELFSHWDYQTSFLEDDMIINGVWERNTTLPSDENYDASTWNAATWHALVETTKEDFNALEDRYQVLGRRAFIDFTPKTLKNAVPIKLIEEPKYFKAADKTSLRPMDENNERYKLSKDQDWTVYVEWQYSSASGIVFSAKAEGGGNGLTIAAASTVAWGNSSRTTPADSATNPILGSSSNTSSCIYAAVISHKKNEDNVYVSFNNVTGLKPVHYTLTATQSMPSNLLIRLGATEDNSGVMSFFDGRIYNCYVYNQYFGESYRSALLGFPHMRIPFDATATGIYSYSSEFTYNDCCGINFTCSCALPWPMKLASSHHDSSLRQYSYNSALMQWLQNRLYNALPATWHVLLQIPYVKYTYNASGYNNSPIWLPSGNEIGTTNSSYNNEFKSSNIYTTAFSRLKAQGAWTLSPTVLLEPEEYEKLGFSTGITGSSATTRPDGTPLITGDIKNPIDQDYDNFTGIYWYGLWNNEWYMWVRGYSSTSTYFGYKYSHSYVSGTTSYSQYFGVVPCFAIGRGKKPFNE